MQEKRQRILKMLEDGSISMDEALTLLENLHEDRLEDNPSTSTDTEKTEKVTEDESVPARTQDKNQQDASDSTEQGEQEEKESTVDDFLNDLRKDFTVVGDRFMQFMQTAVQKVKDFDMETPFGKSVEFTHTATKPAEGIEEILVQITNGKLALRSSDEEEIRAEYTVKAYNHESEEDAKKDFLEKIIFVTDDEKLRVSSDMRMMQVNLDLYVPRKLYKKLAVKLTNGSFKIEDATIDDIHVKTANGKIEASQLVFKEGEFETANGMIYLNDVSGDSVEAETLNGRIYVDGRLKKVEVQSLNGNLAVTTTSEDAEKIEAKTMSGSVELYIPSTLSIVGELSSSVGKLDLALEDIERIAEHDQLFQRTIRFSKEVPGQSHKLHLLGEAKTGTVLARYII